MVALALHDTLAGNGPPMLLIHGGTGSHGHWERVMNPLGRAFSIHAPDLPGYGLSPDVPVGVFGNDYVALVEESLSPLVPQTGVHIVGFSFGGALAAGVTRVWGPRVARLSLIGTAGFGNPMGLKLDMRSRKETDGSDAAEIEVIRHNLATSMFANPGAVDAGAIEQQRWNIAHTRFDSLTVSRVPRLLDDLAHITCPLQLVWGTRDAYAHPSPAARAARVLEVRPDARVDFVVGAGHWTQYEQPDAVVRLLLAFHAPLRALSEQA
jgi:pimeloyl-ACP methyl ester carboxylesterase